MNATGASVVISKAHSMAMGISRIGAFNGLTKRVAQRFELGRGETVGKV
jgi:hypothetical protein